MNSGNKFAIAVLVVVALCWLAWSWLVAGPRGVQSAISYSRFIQEVQAGRVVEVKISAGNLGADAARVRMHDGTTARTILPLDYSAALAAMQQQAVNVEIQEASTSLSQIALNATPFFILLAFWILNDYRPFLDGRR